MQNNAETAPESTKIPKRSNCTAQDVINAWTDESNAANDCIVEILQSYMEFIDIFEKTIDCYAELPEKLDTMARTLIKKRRHDWQPILKFALQYQKDHVKSKKQKD